jgi:hypothetical protein
MGGEGLSVIDMSDEEFERYVRAASFEELKEASEAAVDQLRNRQIGFDAISLALWRVRAMLDECEARILKVEDEIAELEGTPDQS